MTEFLTIQQAACAVSSRDSAWVNDIPPALKRRDPRIWQMAYAAASRALTGAPTAPKSIVVGTALGALDETRVFLEGVYAEGFGSPRSFIASVHNSMAGKLALEFKAPGPNITVCEGQNSFASAIIAASLLRDDEFPVLLIAVDERIAMVDQLHPHFSHECRETLSAEWDDGAAAFLLTREQIPGKGKIRAFGPSPANDHAPHEACKLLLRGIKPSYDGALQITTAAQSFIGPALTVYDLIAKRQPAHAMVGSYSPTSRGVALVEFLC